MRLLLFLLLACGSLLTAEAAFAHATLITSDPADGTVLSAPPRQIKLEFSEIVAPLALRLLDATGKVTALKNVRQQQHSLVVEMPADIGAGTSILSWRVTSQDGHPVGGTVSFSVDKVNQASPSSAVAANPDWRIPLWLAHVLNILLLATIVGGAFFYRWIAPTRIAEPPHWLFLLSPLAIAVALACFAVETFDAVGEVSDLANVSLWWRSIAATSGVSAVFTVAALTLAAFSLRGSSGAARILSLGALGLVGTAYALSGHAATASPAYLMKPMIFLHIVAVLFWSGSLVPLLMLIRRGVPDSLEVLATYSSPIRSALIVLVPSGVIIAIVQLGAFSELWDSGYGVVLSIKLGLLSVLFCLAAVNRFALTPRIKAGDAVALGWLKVSIGGEIALVLLIFCVTSLWRFTPPPREMSAVTILSTGIQFHAHGTRGMANLIVSPARPGPVAVTINVMDVESRPLEVKGVEIVLLDPQNQIEPIRQKAERVTSATWRINEMAIPMAGTWLVRINLLITDFDKVTVRTTLTIINP